VTLGAVQVGDIIIASATRASASDDFASDSCADTLAGSSYASLGHAFSTPDGAGYSWFYSVVVTAGTPTVTITFPGSENFCNIVAEAYRGGSGVVDVKLSASAQQLAGGGADSVTEGPITTTGNGDLVVATVVNTGNADPFTAGTGWTGDQTATVAGGNILLLESLFQTNAGSITSKATCAAGTHGYVGGIASFFLASSGNRTYFNPIPLMSPGRI
jgi:hypothetical protein